MINIKGRWCHLQITINEQDLTSSQFCETDAEFKKFLEASFKNVLEPALQVFREQTD